MSEATITITQAQLERSANEQMKKLVKFFESCDWFYPSHEEIIELKNNPT